MTNGTRALVACAVGAGALAVAGCSPALDWREVRPEGSQARALFPCKPASHARTVSLAARRVELTMYACAAGDVKGDIALSQLCLSNRKPLPKAMQSERHDVIHQVIVRGNGMKNLRYPRGFFFDRYLFESKVGFVFRW